MKIEKKQWSRWEDDKPQLYMEVYDLRQQRMAQSKTQGQPVLDQRGSNVVVTPTDPDPLGLFWQLSDEDKKLKIQKGKRILREPLGNSHDGQSWHITDQVFAQGRTFKRTDLSTAP